MSYLNFQLLRGHHYLYGGLSVRKPAEILGGNAGPPRRIATCIGRIEPISRHLLFNNNTDPWLDTHGDELNSSVYDLSIKNKIDIKFDNITTEMVISNEGAKRYQLVFGKSALLKAIDDVCGKNNNHSVISTQIQTQSQDIGIQTNLLPEISTNSNVKILEINQAEDPNNPEFQIYGSTYLLNHIIKTCGLLNVIQSIFPLCVEKILTLIHYFILEKRRIMYCEYFAHLHNTFSTPKEVASQRLSELFQNITEFQINQFYKSWASLFDDIEDFLCFDLSNVTTFSNKNILAEYGKPKNNNSSKHLKQINFSLLYAQNLGIPIQSLFFPGSLNDVSLLIESIEKLEIIVNKIYTLILDRGLFSKKNLMYMITRKPKIPFLVGLPSTTSLKQELINENKHIFLNPNYYLNSDTGRIYGISKQIIWNHRRLYAHVYKDHDKNKDFHDQLLDDFINIRNQVNIDPADYLNDIDIKEYLKIRKSAKSETGYNITINQNAFQNEILNNGWFVFLSNDIKDPETALFSYRRKDLIEKAFRDYKTRFDLDRPRTCNDRVYQSKSFIGFLCLIVVSKMYEVMHEHQLFKLFTLDELLLKLSTIKVQKRPDRHIISTLTATQKKIYDCFDCPHPVSYLL